MSCRNRKTLLVNECSYKYIIIHEKNGNSELLFPLELGSQSGCFVPFLRVLCILCVIRQLKISVHNIELAPISNSRF